MQPTPLCRGPGVDGKSLNHLTQIDAANAAFCTAAAGLGQARQTIECWPEADAAGTDVVALNRRLLENLHIEEAQHRLVLGDAIAEISQAWCSRRTGRSPPAWLLIQSL